MKTLREMIDLIEAAQHSHPKTWHDVDPKLGRQVDRMTQAEKVNKGLAHSDTLNTEQVYKVVALDKGNALKKPTKMKVKARSLEDLFSRLSANDWYPLEINGIEVIAGKRLKQGVAEGSETEGTATLAKIAAAGDNGYDMIEDGLNGLLGTEAQIMLQDMYDDVSREHRLHPDDDFEQIYDRMMDRIESDYGQQGMAEGNRFDEPLTGYHIVYKNSGNPVLNTPSFETKDQAQKYLMTKMFANHQDFKVVHTANIGMAEMDKSAPQPGRDGKVSHKTYGSRDNYKLGDPETTAKLISAEKVKKDALDILKKQGMAEGMSQTPFTNEELVAINQYLDDDLSFQELKTYPGLIRKIAKYLDIASIQGHMGEMNFYDRLVQAREEGDIPQQGMAEGSEQKYLWHGSRQKIPMLEPRQSVDTGGAAGSNQNAIYATSDPKVAIAVGGLTTPDSDTAMFPNDPQMVLFKGKIRKGENVYLHKLPFYGPDGKPQFVQGAHDREFYSIPSVKGIKPVEIKAVPVNKYLNLIRTATPQDLELRKQNMKQGVAEEQLDETTPEAIEKVNKLFQK